MPSRSKKVVALIYGQIGFCSKAVKSRGSKERERVIWKHLTLHCLYKVLSRRFEELESRIT